MLESHIRFADRYFETLNATQSAIYAGFSEDTAKQQGWQLLQREDIQAYIQTQRDILAEKTGISREKVLAEIARLAFADIRNYYDGDNQLIPVTDLSDDAAAALSSLKVDELYAGEVTIGHTKEIKLYNKLDGLEKLARHLGLYEKDNKQKELTANINLTKEAVQKLSDDLDAKY